MTMTAVRPLLVGVLMAVLVALVVAILIAVLVRMLLGMLPMTVAVAIRVPVFFLTALVIAMLEAFPIGVLMALAFVAAVTLVVVNDPSAGCRGGGGDSNPDREADDQAAYLQKRFRSVGSS